MLATVLAVAFGAGGCGLDGPALGHAPEPYAVLGGGACTGRPAPLSPDPMASYQWGRAVDTTPLQLFTRSPVGVTVRTGAGNVTGAASATTRTPAITVSGSCTVLLDFGAEMPGWLELDSADLASAAAVRLGVGEYDAPWESAPGSSYKAGTPKAYPGGGGGGGGKNHTTTTTYRLETNAELYEGVRFGFLFVEAGPAFRTFTITGLRLVVQTKAVNYTGHFHAATDPLLEKVWWTAAWTVRSNLLESYFGS